MELNEIKQITVELMDALKASGLGEVVLETKDIKIKLKAKAPAPVAPVAAAPVAAAPAAAPAAADAPAPAAEDDIPGTKVTAPLVGTFYASPSPDEPPYIEVGQTVKKGDTLFIIEAMKTMNEIEAPCDGTVSRILAQAGDMVEYGQTLVVIS
ncbi:MAG: acetyl-CoA carboxylase biotin carboxyl carrier protein [Butyricicoccus sp.]|nr:acetyl-CoA carboxylase biotin carboxyl carrier protein [Butyricicoccus sp.]